MIGLYFLLLLGSRPCLLLLLPLPPAPALRLLLLMAAVARISFHIRFTEVNNPEPAVNIVRNLCCGLVPQLTQDWL